MAFTGQRYAEDRECPHCVENRYIEGTDKLRKTFVYITLMNRLRLQYRNAVRAKVLVEYRLNFMERARQGKTSMNWRTFFTGSFTTVWKLGLFKSQTTLPCIWSTGTMDPSNGDGNVGTLSLL
jgi:hypothetical protein